MADWSPEELPAIGGADELRVVTAGQNGSPRRVVPVWVIADGDDLYLRSAYGTSSAWYRRALTQRQGRIDAGGIDIEVTFTPVDDAAINDRIDAGYRTKYRRYGASYVDRMVAPQARHATLKISPRQESREADEPSAPRERSTAERSRPV
ncbi:hypothetical protein Ait01nite_091480 [Actinoplanes italicus]|jgi:hypothetical protein|uniref:DUF2255 family protein n=1 Tax=Actinoplanes italicus TaxID=113567 RepID=A0A2T0JSE8_9ACTN|nr:DUF2255 family protein [Actinoplanes italicus]PRX10549.1 hypothetical protein CLV67_13329 [Actinoplanes italicus]GIE36103.1 hypothetical protein Ait01nite_091480 [Actinoplanes italicus]